MNSSDEYESSSCGEDDALRGIFRDAKTVDRSQLPNKSLKWYLLEYDALLQWMKKTGRKDFGQDTFYCYFGQLFRAHTVKDVWDSYCKLKKVVNIKHNINISSFAKLTALFRKKSKRYRPKASRAFTWEQVNAFLETAPDDVHLANKVIWTFGFLGALRTEELCKLTTSDITDNGRRYLVSVRDTKTCEPRSFTIEAPYYERVRKYASLRPRDIDTPKFFISYHLLKCSYGIISTKKIAETPQVIASFLKLPEPDRYTCHTFRRTFTKLSPGQKSSAAEDHVDRAVRRKTGKFQRVFISDSQYRDTSENSTFAEPPPLVPISDSSGARSTTGRQNSSSAVASTSAVDDDPSDGNLLLTKTRWKGLRDVYRAELKREVFAERMNITRRRRGRWMPYNHMTFLQSQMVLVPEDEDLSKKIHVKTEIDDSSFVEVDASEDPLANFTNSDEAQDSVNHPSSLISESLSEDQSFSLTGDESNQEQQVKPELNNHYDDNYHFLISLVPHMKKLPDERQMLLRIKMQELVYKEVYKTSD